MANPSDSLTPLQARDPRALAELHQELYRPLQALCFRLLGDSIAAEHAADDVWTDFVVSHVDHLQQGEAAGAYLRMVAVRHCCRLREFQAKHRELPELTDDRIGAEDELIRESEARRQTRRLERCLGRLTARARRIVRLRYHREMTQESIGQAVGLTKQYIGRILAKSLEQLRRCMEEQT